MSKQSIRRWLLSRMALLAIGAVCLRFSADLIVDHLTTVASVREVTVPLLSELPALERREAILEQQLELARLNAAMRDSSAEEKIHVYALPDTFDLEKTIATFDVFRLVLEEGDSFATFSPIQIGEEMTVAEGIAAVPISFRVVVHNDGLDDLMSLVRLAGAVTIADTLTPSELTILFQESEQENPAGIVALESFLATDLMTYVHNQTSVDAALRRSFTGPAFLRLFDDILGHSVLKDARYHLKGRLGQVLSEKNLWPLPFLSLRTITLQPGGSLQWSTVDIELLQYRRQ